jgi:acetyl-CoA acetyltransferase family protein
MDIFAAESHQRAATAAASGAFKAEIVSVPREDGDLLTDETIRPATTVEGLKQLKIAFKTDEMAARFPQIQWGVTAGNSSQLADGASVLLLASEEAIHRHGWRARARFVGFDVIADDPLLMLTAPIPATHRVLKKAKLKLSNIDHFEVNEAFASVPLAWLREFVIDPRRLNPCGGAIALGHPLGASGARIMTTMLHALERNGGHYGLQTMCEAGGMANATVIERL